MGLSHHPPEPAHAISVTGDDKLTRGKGHQIARCRSPRAAPCSASRRARDLEQVACGQPDKPDAVQSNRAEVTGPDGENNPTQTAETTQSITGIDQQENNSQSDDDTNNSQHDHVVAVPNLCCDLDTALLDRLQALGISPAKSLSFQQDHGIQRIREVLTYAESASLRNPAGFVIRALEENWSIRSRSQPASNNHLADNRYITGKYAAFIKR